MPKLEIDGISVDADPGTTIIEVADRLNIHIPRFCYHHKLSVAANCRMCLVQVEKSNKALPACATPVADGMKVWTKSKETMAAQHSVMEFLLINHPLDCPICDQGGECELQDVSMQYGRSDSRFTEPKRVVLDNDLGSLIESDMTRCIQCTRCVRFGDEVSGERELGATGRGEHMEIGTYVAQTINSEVSGNIIDLCPVGALTSKPFRFTARPWELTQVPGISPHDCIGSNLYWHIQEHVKRVVPKDTEELNEVWLSDRDRYSYAGLRHADRLHKPLLHKQRWSTAGWMEALKYAASAIKTIVDTHGVNELGVLVTPNATTEELYLLQKFVRGLDCNNIDHRLRQLDFNDQHLAPKYPNLGMDYRSIADLDTILLIGCNIAKEQPLAALRVRKAAKKGAKVCALNCVDYHYNFDIAAKCIVPAANFLASLAALAKELINICNYKADSATTAALASIEVDQQVKSIAASLKSGAKKQIILGHIAQMHPQASQIVALGNLIAQIIGGNCGSFSDGANAAGAWLTGCVPHRLPNGDAAPQAGKNALQMLQTPLRAYILYAVEPEFDSILGVQALDSLLQADVVIAISPYQSDTLLEIADIILPLAHFSEMSGSMININGTQQQFVAALEPFGESRPGWKILRMLGSMTELEGFAFNTLEEVTAEMQSAVVVGTALPKWQAQTLTPIAKTASKDLLRIAPLSLYAVDGLVRRATPLQATEDAHSDP
ncbi:MAG TPA: NADH-quinone oxidoreductase subunit NuoG, partial [Gammaproteobacteria bacterium]|nr:NADH-quinone oxidoreductase subunit NuoG [Gammaproteobacteria bacterium]